MADPVNKARFTLPKVNGHDPTPKYLQAREILVGAIRAGHYEPGEKLPSTAELSAQIDISLITAHKALEGLVEAGWLRREVGRGTFVRDDVNPREGVQRPVALGLVIDHRVNIDDYYHSSLINGLRLAARRRGEQAELFFTDRFEARRRTDKEVGMICIHPPLTAQEQVQRLAQRSPTIVLGGSYPEADVPAVDCDNYAAAAAAARHVLKLGHRRVLVLSGPLELSNSRDRMLGVTDTLAADGVPLAPENRPVARDAVVLDDDTRDLLAARLADSDRPTAIIAGGFYLALAAMQAAHAAGLRIPDDLSIVGFDDPASAPLLNPPLTTLRQPLAEMASRAFARIDAAVHGRPLDAGVEKLSAELVVRASTGAAAG